MEIVFQEPVLQGVTGRNGAANFGGLQVHAFSGMVELTPTAPNGGALNSRMSLMAGDCGKVVRAIAQAAAEADPGVKEELAAQLRAALVAVECGTAAEPDDGVSTFFIR